VGAGGELDAFNSLHSETGFGEATAEPTSDSDPSSGSSVLSHFAGRGGIFAVLGNHEFYAGHEGIVEACKKRLKKVACRLHRVFDLNARGRFRDVVRFAA